VKFWDASAVVPLCLTQPESPIVRDLVVADPGLVVWWATRTECLSALLRGQRERRIGPEAIVRARAVLTRLAAEWSEVQPSEPVRARAERLLGVHALSAADALQLAAALLWCRGETAGNALISFDQGLREAARREGFVVEPD
jgi:predicted nucleic acid-binding protein